MVHINDLDPEVLYLILCLASGRLARDIDKWKHKLPFLQVCTKWYDLFKSYAFSQGFVDIYPLDYNEYSEANLKSCVYYADNAIVCRSNLGIITGRDKHNCDCVTELKVEVVGSNLHIIHYGHVLGMISTLGVGYWINLSSLVFGNYAGFEEPLEFQVPNLDKLSLAVSQYFNDFRNSVPNITHLRLSNYVDKILPTAFLILIDHYAPRLQYLHFHYPIKSSLPSFSTELTYISLGLKDYTHRHPSFYAKSLQYLELYGISSSNFSWWIFHNFTTPGCIEFTNLKTLELNYKDQTDGEKKLSEKYLKQARPYGSHMLQFPSLENLTLVRPPVDCDVLFTDTIPTCLKELNIRGSCDSVVAASRLRFKSVGKLYIDVYREETPTNAFYIAADRYFGYTKIGSTCTVDFSLLVDIQRTASWINITDLRLGHIEFTNLLKLVPNLYNLQNLFLRNVHVSDECLSIIQSGLDEEERGKFELLDTRVEYLVMIYVEPDDPHHLLAILNHLLLRITTLKKVRTSKVLGSSFLSEKFHCSFYFDR